MIIRSPYPDVTIPEIPLPELILRQTERLADKPALIDGPSGRTLTYGQFGAGVRQVAAGLAARGFGRGQVFGIYCPNVPEYALAFHGVVLSGGTNTTVNPLYTVPELVKQLNDCKARFLLTVPMFLENALAAAQETDVEEVFVLGEGEGATSFQELMRSGPLPEVEYDVRNDLVVLPYSSGTTGTPKGVMLTHFNLVANILQFQDLEPTGEADTLIGILPFFHIYGMTVIMNAALSNGATIVTLPRFDLEQFLKTLQDYRITRAHVVPPIVLALAKHPLVSQFDLSSLRTIMSGAAPLGEELSRECAQRLNVLMKQGYGMTELSPVSHVTPDEPEKVVYGSAGVALPNTECKIVDVSSGEAQEVGARGELCIRGPQVMAGYLNNPEATAETIDADGWLHTGDIAEVDAQGYFRIVDRVKELIKYKGFQVAPAELEALLVSHSEVADAAVVPYSDEEAGEVPRAFVVRQAGSSVTEEELLAFVAEQVAPYKKVRRLEFTDQIPKSASGKILRRVLRDQP
jgi:acyl-CoA synthetase (AMP-forming)/AMP-acid ligase II